MSIRMRLTLLYSLILVGTLAGFSTILYLTMERSTRVFMEDTLSTEMKRLVRSNDKPLRYIQWPTSTTANTIETYWQACDGKGNVLGRTDNLRDHILPLSDDGLRRVQAGESFYNVADVDGTPMLVYSQPVVNEGKTTGIIQVARSIAEQQQALGTLQTYLLAGGIFTLLLAVISGWFLAGASLRPIDHLTRTAQVIGTEKNFRRRVEYRGPQDEIGRLATTFNNMLAALEGAYAQVAQALQTQRWFIADASHELRTPLTTLRGNLALLQREPPIAPDDRTAVLADIVDENERMIRLVNDLMTLARAEYAPNLELETVSLQALFSEIERQVGNLPSSRCNFQVQRAPSTPVKAKRDTLKQVLLILLDNAFKFTPAGCVELSAEQKGNLISIRVRDTGIGIEKDTLPHIFQRFYRGNHARNGNGYGLGLAIARTLVEKQNGHIQAESEPGRGSIFTVTLFADTVSLAR
jgi:two-component system OmpR family sensor kinase